MKSGDLLLVSGNANRPLAEEIANYLSVRLCDAVVDTFTEGEIRVQILQDVRGTDAFVIQPTCSPNPNRNLMELLIMIDALRRASADRITAVLPYYGYARQDRKDRPRVPITAKLVANLIIQAGANRVLTLDLHAGQIQGFFDIPLDHLFAVNAFVDYFERKNLKNIVVVSPDVGGIKTARAYAKKFRCDLAIVDKRRLNEKETEVMNILGEVKDRNVIMVDDIVATAGSLCEAAEAVKRAGAQKVYAAITHPVLTGPAIDRLRNAPIDELAVTNSIPVGKEKQLPNLKILSVAPLLGEAIRRIHNSESVSGLFGSMII